MSKSGDISRRYLLGSGALVALGLALPISISGAEEKTPSEKKASPIRLGLASYTFRNFPREQVIEFMKQMKVVDLNAKDIKDHLPTDAEGEARAVADYNSAGIKLHAAGAIYFPKDEDDDIRAKFEYCKRAGIRVIVAGDPAPGTLPRIEKFV